jgi:two-component system sensor histidine kinase UhpB
MQTLSENFNILVVEDNPSDLFLLEHMLQSSAFKINNIYKAARISSAIELLKDHNIGLVLLDLTLPDSFGIDSFLQIKDVAQKIPVIILTGISDSEIALEALKQNAQDYLVKGEFNASLLIKSIEYSIERKKAEERIISSEQKYRQIFYRNPFPMWINDLETFQILEVNDAAIQKYGYEREEFLKLTLKDIGQDGITDSSSLMVSDKEEEKLWRHKKKNGDRIIVEITCYNINYFGKTAMQVQINDVTEKIRLQKEITLKKRQIIEAVLNAQEKERKAIGEELHDNINQILTAIKLNLAIVLEDPIKNNGLIPKCIDNASVVIEEIRKLSKALILSGNLKELGLVQSIKELIKDFRLATKMRVSLNFEDLDESGLSEDQKMAIYRIVQEQLNNIIKHTQASLVTIDLNILGEQVSLCITDNGNGFDTGIRRNGICITNIISRAELFNGKVDINSSVGNGCCMKVILNPKALLPHDIAY